jgi:Zn-dependent peptidase ImmA (M78 family)
MPDVNTHILKWARENAELTLEEASAKLAIKSSGSATAAEKLKAYESGDQPPSRALLLEMEKRYRRPLITFYLAEPPRKGDRGEDFRTLKRGYHAAENVLVDALIRNIKSRQATIRSALIDEDEADPIPFVGGSNGNESVSSLAQSVRKAIGFNLSEFRDSSKPEEAFALLRGKVEAARVFVLLVGDLGSHHSTINTTLFRGFVLSDDIAPFIVINDQDSKAAWSFTLLHELVHLWLGRTGLSGGYSEQGIEKFCNDVASEILLPKEEILNFSIPEDDFTQRAAKLSDFAALRNLSSSLVAYRLYRMGTISKGDWHKFDSYFADLRRTTKLREQERNRKKESGPSYFIVRRYKLGNALVSLVERLTRSGTLTATKAALVLGVRPLKVHKLFGSRDINGAMSN